MHSGAGNLKSTLSAVPFVGFLTIIYYLHVTLPRARRESTDVGPNGGIIV